MGKDDGDLERMSVEGGDSAIQVGGADEPTDVRELLGVEAVHLSSERAEEEEEEL